MEGVPGELIQICHRALRKNPDDRYQKVSEVSDDLNRFLESKTRLILRRRFRGALKQMQTWLGFERMEKPLISPGDPSPLTMS